MTKTIGVKFAIGATTSTTVASAFATVDTKVKSLKANFKELNTVSERASRLMTADARLQAARTAHLASPTEKTTTELRSAEKALKSAQRAADKYNISVAESAKVHAKAQTALKSTEAALARQERLQANAAKRQELHGQMLGTVASFATVAVPVKLAMDFESSFADVKKVIDFASEEEEKAVQKDIRELSSKTGLAASGIAGIYAAAGSAKLATSREELQAFADTAAQMAVAFGMSADDAGQKMASWRSKMGMSQEEVVALADAINHLGNNMAADPLKTAEVVERMGSVAKGSGLAAKSIAALSASFVAASPSPEIAATGMKNFLLAMTKGDALSKDQKSTLARLGIKNPKQLAAAMQKDAEGTILSVMQSIQRIPKDQQAAILSELFGSESLGAIQPLLENLDTLKNAFGAVAKAEDYNGSMNKEYISRSKTTENALQRLRRTAESLGIGLGSTLLPGITAVAQGTAALLGPVINVAETFPNVTLAVVAVVGSLVALKLAAWGGAYAGTVISDGWSIAKGIFNAVRPSVLANTMALQRQRIVTLGTAAATKVKIFWEKAHAFALAMSSRQTALATLAQMRHRAVTLTTAAAQKVFNLALMTSPLSVLKLAGAQKVLNLAMRANPIVRIVTVLAALAGWFYTAYAKAGSFTGAVKIMWDQFKAVVPAMEVVQAAVVGMVTFVSDVWNGASLYDAGSKLMSTLWDGVKAMWERIKGYWQTVKGWFGFGEGEDVDIKTVAESKTVSEQTTVGQTETKAQPANTASTEPGTASTKAPQTAAQERAQSPASSSSGAQSSVRTAPSGGGAIQVIQQFSFQLNGMPEKEFATRVVDAVKAQRGELEKVLRDIVANQRRLAYDS